MEIRQEIAEVLTSHGWKIAVAESCTGGWIATHLTALPGASEWFEAGVVSYSAAAKEGLLLIPAEELTEGLVTESTASTMAQQIAYLTGAECTLATTGVCGPNESEGHKPCYVWVAICLFGEMYGYLYQGKDRGREANREAAGTFALQQLRDLLHQLP